MKVCKACSKPMDDTFNVCPHCGAPADSQPAEENFNQNNNQQNFYQNAQQNNQPPFYAGFQPNPNYQPDSKYRPEPRPQRSAYVAALLAFFGGMFGLHNFYLDYKKTAIIQLVVTLAGFVLTFGIASIAMQVWAVIDCIKLLKGEINIDGTGAKIKL